MSQYAPGPARPLPGLAKLYLLQLYPLALAMLCARFALAAVGLKGGPEPVFWSVVFFGFGAAAVIVIAGIHFRAGWARYRAAGLNLGLCLLCVAGILRVLIFVSEERLWGYGFGPGEMGLALAPAVPAMYIPMFFAWRRYFSGSSKLDEDFGPAAPAMRLPPAGVGILQTLSASFVLFYLTFFLIMAVAGGSEAFPEGGYAMLADSLPKIIFFTAFFILCTYPGRRQKPLLIALTAFAVLMGVWGHVPYLLAELFFRNGGGFSLYSLLQTFSALPMDNFVMAVLAAMLAWKIWADPTEQAWFADAQAIGRVPSTFGLYNIVLLFYALSSMSVGLITLAYSLRGDGSSVGWQNISIFILATVTVALHCLAIYNRTAKRWSDNRLSLASFAASAVTALTVAGLLLLDMFSAEELRYQFYSFSYNLPVFLTPLAGSVMALLHWRHAYAAKGENAPGRASLFSLSGPPQAFSLFCVLLMVAMLSERIAHIAGGMLRLDDLYPVREGAGLAGMLLDFEFWAAYIVCPALALKWLRAGLPKRGNAYILGAVWVGAIISSMLHGLLGLFSRRHYYDLDIYIHQILDPVKQVYICIIILFMVYLAASRGKTPGGIEKRQ